MDAVMDAPDLVRGMAVLVAVAERSSFSEAAIELGLTPSAVSKVIARLEARVGAKLLNRTTRRVQLTEAGAAFCAGARRVLEDIEGLEREAESRHPHPHGVLRVTAPTLLGQVRVLPVVLAFAREHKSVKVNFDLSDGVVDIIDEGIDVAIRMTATPPASFAAKWLADDDRVLCASPAYLARQPAPKRPEDLSGHECVLFASGKRVPEVWRLQPGAGQQSPAAIPVRGRLHLGSTAAVREAALAGFGIADLPRYLAADDLAAGRLLTVLDDHVVKDRAIYAVFVPSPFVPTKVRLFVAALAAAFAAPSPAPARIGRAAARAPASAAAKKKTGRRL